MWDIYIQKYTTKEIIMKKFGYKTETLMEDVIMSYEKLGFTSGQTLKAEHLNHIEDGIANAGGATTWDELEGKPFAAVSMSPENGMLSHTPAEILDMADAGKMVLCHATGTTFVCHETNGSVTAHTCRLEVLDDEVILLVLHFDAKGMLAGADSYALTATKQ